MMNEKSGVVSLSYFSCTLGEAAVLKSGNPTNFKTINDLIDLQAERHPKRYAVGFPTPKDGHQEWGSELFTFQDLQQGSWMSEYEIAILRNQLGSFRTIALLCPSSVDFLFSWLRLLRAGYSVLIIAPQCQPEAITYLCKSCTAPLLLYHQQFSEKAKLAAELSETLLKTIKIPWKIAACSFKSQNTTPDIENKPSEHDIAYIFHTSGTSSGLPKAIPQTHHAAVGVLPCLEGQDSATFTTTPLYHGGIADCFRAWSSSAMIWLFPGTSTPITTNNIIRCLSAAQSATTGQYSPVVKYFSSVPYVLEMLSNERGGVSMLQRMDLVGVGGAALSSTIGDCLVQNGVKLFSRFGSAECGFLLSSNREFEIDKEWQYLRVPPGSEYLRFEGQEDGSRLSELQVLKGWPHMAKLNREDGNFSTSDLFEPHPTISTAWRYHSRDDSQIMLITGKKFDPAPMEDEIRCESARISDVFIFGNGQQIPGALIFSTKNSDTYQEDFTENVWTVIQKVNQRGQNHTRISRNMVAIMPPEAGGLKKSSKGTTLRNEAEKAFSTYISQLYGDVQLDVKTTLFEDMTGDEIKRIIRSIIAETLQSERRLEEDSDFYQHGVDSNQCTYIRSQLEKKLELRPGSLPWNIAYDCGNIKGLIEYLIDRKNGSCGTGNRNSETQQMFDLVKRFSVFKPRTKHLFKYNAEDSPNTLVVLTGATGSLGTHILETIRRDPAVSQVICLVRASSYKDARSRVSDSLVKRNKLPLGFPKGRVICVPSNLSIPSLGVSPELLKYIQQKTTHIIHAAWAVNFSISLNSFVDHLAGLNNLLTLGMSSSRQAQVIFCSSTASVMGPNNSAMVKETISSDPKDSDALAYSRSKWVAEAICSAASREKGMRQRVKILRIGQLTGDTENGIWNMSEAWPLMLSTVDVLKCLPRLEEKLTWLPMDTAAKAVLDITFWTSKADDNPTTCHVYHIVNDNSDSNWLDLLNWIQKRSSQQFEIVELHVWLKRLDGLDTHSAKNLTVLWKSGTRSKSQGEKPCIIFDTRQAKEASEILRKPQVIDEVIVGKIWDWLKNEIALKVSAVIN